jgi:hypothetical protein
MRRAAGADGQTGYNVICPGTQATAEADDSGDPSTQQKFWPTHFFTTCKCVERLWWTSQSTQRSYTEMW